MARSGRDDSVITLRQGRKVPWQRARHDPDLMSVAGWVAATIEEIRPKRVFIDITGGYGAAVYDRLVELGYGQVVVGVNFGEKASRPARFREKRSEMWGSMRDWLDEGADIPDDDTLQADLVGPQRFFLSNNQLYLESKQAMKDRGLASPDKGDSLGLTFAYEVPTDDFDWDQLDRTRPGNWRAA